MGAETVNLFGHIGLDRQHRQFLRHAGLIGAIAVVQHPRQLRAQVRGDLGSLRASAASAALAVRVSIIANLIGQNLSQAREPSVAAHLEETFEKRFEIRQQRLAKRPVS